MVNKATKIIQDIVVKNKTSSSEALKKILEKNTKPFLSEENKFKKKKSASTKQFSELGEQRGGTQKNELKTKKMRGKLVFNLVVILAVIIVVTKIIDAYSYAIVQITPHQETSAVEVILKSDQSDTADLSHETMELNLTEQTTIKASGVENVASKASGKIIVYNTFGPDPQMLVINTRFETPDGKIYRINKATIVPGVKIVDGKAVPGSVEVTAYADEAGESYNIGLSDFTIPGFKDSPRYEKFYGRSKTPMEGGYKGERPVVSEGDFENVKKTLENSIREKLLTEAHEKVPDNFIMLDGAVDISFDINNGNVSPEEQEKFTLKETGNLLAIMIPKKNLSDVLVEKYLGVEFKNKVEVANLEDLNFSVINLNTEKKSLIFKVEGEAKFVWVINEENLKEALMASKKDMQAVFEEYPDVEVATVIFKPSWWRIFPAKINNISIEQQIKEN